MGMVRFKETISYQSVGLGGGRGVIAHYATLYVQNTGNLNSGGFQSAKSSPYLGPCCANVLYVKCTLIFTTFTLIFRLVRVGRVNESSRKRSPSSRRSSSEHRLRTRLSRGRQGSCPMTRSRVCRERTKPLR